MSGVNTAIWFFLEGFGVESVDFDGARSGLGLNRREFCEALGLDLRTGRRYANGSVSIPRYIELACWALKMRPRLEALVSGLKEGG